MPSARRIVLLIAVGLAAIYAWRAQAPSPQLDQPASPPVAEAPARIPTPEAPKAGQVSDAPLTNVSEADLAHRDQRSGVMLTVSGTVDKVLADDRDGSPHQRFIVRLPSGLTLLIAHNIELAPRVADIGVGSPIELRGEYEWNAKGGVVHWTHRDPRGSHEGGWIEYGGQRYQ